MELLALCLQPLWVLASCQSCCFVGLLTNLRQKEKQCKQSPGWCVCVATDLVESLLPFVTSQRGQGYDFFQCAKPCKCTLCTYITRGKSHLLNNAKVLSQGVETTPQLSVPVVTSQRVQSRPQCYRCI